MGHLLLCLQQFLENPGKAPQVRKESRKMAQEVKWDGAGLSANVEHTIIHF